MLATTWHAGWHEAHATLLPAELTAQRTLASLVERLPALLADTTVAVIDGRAIGFCIIEKDELYQLYVDPSARGLGVALALVEDAQARLAAHGVRTAWLACAIGNVRAARFYEKCGWIRVANMINPAFTASGPYPLETWRYERLLAELPSEVAP